MFGRFVSSHAAGTRTSVAPRVGGAADLHLVPPARPLLPALSAALVAASALQSLTPTPLRAPSIRLPHRLPRGQEPSAGSRGRRDRRRRRRAWASGLHPLKHEGHENSRFSSPMPCSPLITPCGPRRPSMIASPRVDAFPDAGARSRRRRDRMQVSVPGVEHFPQMRSWRRRSRRPGENRDELGRGPPTKRRGGSSRA